MPQNGMNIQLERKKTNKKEVQVIPSDKKLHNNHFMKVNLRRVNLNKVVQVSMKE